MVAALPAILEGFSMMEELKVSEEDGRHLCSSRGRKRFRISADVSIEVDLAEPRW